MTRLAKQKVGLSYVGKRYDSSTLKIASAPHQSVSNEYAMAMIVAEAGIPKFNRSLASEDMAEHKNSHP